VSQELNTIGMASNDVRATDWSSATSTYCWQIQQNDPRAVGCASFTMIGLPTTVSPQ